ncbi:MAG: ParB/RepB/Spo0J family partition protein [Alphaproteobacteria bacterium]|nr:ParB/RepB/Spo0J family partition protein [Alphaproteobacteria bacterium]
MDKNLGLGKGLSALMGEDLPLMAPAYSKNTDGIVMISIDDLAPSPFQPRRVFNEEALVDLVSSIREKGVLQPLLVRPSSTGEAAYEIIAGERRFRASKIAGLSEVPVIVKNFDDKATLEVALIENLQREDLNPLEEAEAYKRLMEEFTYTQDELSKVVGKSRSHVANMMRLLDLPDSIKKMVADKKISIGHARALLNAKNPDALAQQVVSKGLSVRQTEKLAVSEGGKTTRKSNLPQFKKTETVYKKDGDLMALETELTNLLQTQVSIKWNGKGGEVVIAYDGLEKLDMILQKLTMAAPGEE